MTQEKCDICGKPAVYDGKTKNGPWGYLCQKCFEKYGDKRKGMFTTLANIGTPGRAPYSD